MTSTVRSDHSRNIGYGKQQFLFDRGESTDLALMVETHSKDERCPWDAARIRDALIREAGVDPDTALSIAAEIEEEVLRCGKERLNTSIIREMANVKLFQRGLDISLVDHSRVGIPLYDLEAMMFFPNKENSNTAYNPESINLTIAERIIKDYALSKLFSSDVSGAHLAGDIHLHDLGMVIRPYCSGQSPAYVARFGLNLPSITSVSSPAKHPDVFLAHILKMTSVLQNNFAGAIGWDAMNMFFAPYLEGLSDEDIRQLAQMLIFEFNQLAGGRGGQVAFTDINLYYEIPKHFRDVPAIGPGGKWTGKTYGDYASLSKRFLKALFEVYLEGDSRSQPFFFPKPLLHITDAFFEEEGWEEMLELACLVAAEKGNTYFVFDRGGVTKLSECCRLSFELTEEDLLEAKTPWKMRYSALQNVTINLPRIAYRSQRDTKTFFGFLEEFMELALKAHIQKRNFIKNLLDLKDKGPLSLLSVAYDGESYLRMNKTSHLIGLLGLNETVQVLTGKELHEGPDAEELGLAIVKFMELKCQELTEKAGFKVVLEQTPAESTAHRFARLDLKEFPLAREVVKGNPETNEVFYTNSTHIPYEAPVDPIDRVVREGRFHPLIKAGAITHVWMGEHKPNPKALMSFVRKTFLHSENAQVTFSPEFTICNDCGKVERGLQSSCVRCGSSNVDGVTRITGYFTKISSWNAGKRAELADRKRWTI
jgi:ribonucleoside-triphosphate reductase